MSGSGDPADAVDCRGGGGSDPQNAVDGTIDRGIGAGAGLFDERMGDVVGCAIQPGAVLVVDVASGCQREAGIVGVAVGDMHLPVRPFPFVGRSECGDVVGALECAQLAEAMSDAEGVVGGLGPRTGSGR